jgi:hypothetical protein
MKGDEAHQMALMEETIDSYANEAKQLRAEKAHAVKALAAVMDLIERGELVRDVTNDNAPDWAARMVGLVATLKDAAEVLALAKVSP